MKKINRYKVAEVSKAACLGWSGKFSLGHLS